MGITRNKQNNKTCSLGNQDPSSQEFQSIRPYGRKAAYLVLVLAVILETVGNNILHVAEGFTRFWPSIFALIFLISSYALLVFILKYLPLGLTYGVWGGFGTLATVASGIFLWGDTFNLTLVLGVTILITGLILTAQGDQEAQEAAAEILLHTFEE